MIVAIYFQMIQKMSEYIELKQILQVIEACGEGL
jgi:hypothetical protein